MFMGRARQAVLRLLLAHGHAEEGILSDPGHAAGHGGRLGEGVLQRPGSVFLFLMRRAFLGLFLRMQAGRLGHARNVVIAEIAGRARQGEDERPLHHLPAPGHFGAFAHAVIGAEQVHRGRVFRQAL